MFTNRHRSFSILAACWSAAYGVLGMWWTTHGGFPFGVGPESGPASSLWAGVRPDAGAPAVALLGFAGAVVAILLLHEVTHRSLVAFGWAMAATLLVLVPDARAIVAAAYAPVFLLGAPFGWPPESANYWVTLPWPVVNQYLCMIGGFAWAATALASSRLSRGACVVCGRSERRGRWTSPAMVARWGRWSVSVAVLVPLCYATTRLAWTAGIPLGIPEKFHREGQAMGMWWAGASLAAVAIGGAILTVGLIRPWGEVFPRWFPVVGGRRVPPMLAIVPASVVSVIVFAAGINLVRSFAHEGFHGLGWGAGGPGLLWPLWGVALGAATRAYHWRRRGARSQCGLA